MGEKKLIKSLKKVKEKEKILQKRLKRLTKKRHFLQDKIMAHWRSLGASSTINDAEASQHSELFK